MSELNYKLAATCTLLVFLQEHRRESTATCVHRVSVYVHSQVHPLRPLSVIHQGLQGLVGSAEGGAGAGAGAGAVTGAVPDPVLPQVARVQRVSWRWRGRSRAAGLLQVPRVHPLLPVLL